MTGEHWGSMRQQKGSMREQRGSMREQEESKRTKWALAREQSGGCLVSKRSRVALSSGKLCKCYMTEMSRDLPLVRTTRLCSCANALFVLLLPLCSLMLPLYSLVLSRAPLVTSLCSDSL